VKRFQCFKVESLTMEAPLDSLVYLTCHSAIFWLWHAVVGCVIMRIWLHQRSTWMGRHLSGPATEWQPQPVGYKRTPVIGCLDAITTATAIHILVVEQFNWGKQVQGDRKYKLLLLSNTLMHP